MQPAVRALRGATTLDADTVDQVRSRVQEMVEKLLSENGLAAADLISVIFTATDDIVSMFPATAARELGLDDVPLMCARELAVNGAKPLCVRVLMHVYSDRPVGQLQHVYLRGAKGVRDEVPR